MSGKGHSCLLTFDQADCTLNDIRQAGSSSMACSSDTPAAFGVLPAASSFCKRMSQPACLYQGWHVDEWCVAIRRLREDQCTAWTQHLHRLWVYQASSQAHRNPVQGASREPSTTGQMQSRQLPGRTPLLTQDVTSLPIPAPRVLTPTRS